MDFRTTRNASPWMSGKRQGSTSSRDARSSGSPTSTTTRSCLSAEGHHRSAIPDQQHVGGRSPGSYAASPRQCSGCDRREGISGFWESDTSAAERRRACGRSSGLVSEDLAGRPLVERESVVSAAAVILEDALECGLGHDRDAVVPGLAGLPGQRVGVCCDQNTGCLRDSTVGQASFE